MAEDTGANNSGIGSGDSTGGGAATPAPNLNQPQEGSMTVGGRVYTAAEISAAANPEGAEKKDAGGTAASTAAGSEKKDAAEGATREGFIPRDRYNQVTQQLRETRILAGLDPDTGKPAAKVDAAGKAADPIKGQEPWAKDLVPMPRSDDKDAKGADKYPDTQSFLEALADAKAHNRVVEMLGKRAMEDAAKQAEAQKTQQAEQDNQAIHKFTSEAIPAALVARGLLKEGALIQDIGPAFDAALKPLTQLPPMERQSQFLYNFAIKNSVSKADLLLAVAEEAKTPEGVAHILKMGSLDDNALINELVAMDRLVSLGLTIRGKPRPAAQKLGKDGKPLTTGNGGSNGGSEAGNGAGPSPQSNGNGVAADFSGLSGEALFKHLESERDAKNKRILERYKRN